MTTAHRPTFHAAVGGKEQGGGRYVSGVTRTHVHDLASQMNLKTRAPGQGAASDLTADKAELRAALEAREMTHLQGLGKAPAGQLAALKARLPPPPPPPVDDDDDDEDDGPALLIDPDDADDRVKAPAGGGGAVSTHPPPGRSGGASAAADDDDDDDDDEDDDDDDEEDEEEELMRELERIKKERAAEAAKKEREERDEAAAEHDSSVLQANPLLDPTRPGAGAGAGAFAVKRRWDDDVVFKNQSREPKKEARRFINDTVRNDFHKRFLNKYVK